MALWAKGPLCTHQPQKTLLLCVLIPSGSENEEKEQGEGVSQEKLVFY